MKEEIKFLKAMIEDLNNHIKVIISRIKKLNKRLEP